jgi:hypothetical protein
LQVVSGGDSGEPGADDEYIEMLVVHGPSLTKRESEERVIVPDVPKAV